MFRVFSKVSELPRILGDVERRDLKVLLAFSISSAVGGGSMAKVVALLDAPEAVGIVFFIIRESKKDSRQPPLSAFIVASGGWLGLICCRSSPVGDFVMTSGIAVFLGDGHGTEAILE